MRGFFGIGAIGCKNSINTGTLWRSAHMLGASFIFTVGRRYKKQASDTTKAWKHVPMLEFATFDDLKDHLPREARIVGVEMHPTARPLHGYTHPERCVYLLGAEDTGIPDAVVERCHDLIVLPGPRSLNVSVAGSIVMYDRHAKAQVGLRVLSGAA